MSEWKIPPDGGHMERPSGIYYQTMTGKQIEDRLPGDDLIIIPPPRTEAPRLAPNPGGGTLLGMPGNIVIPEETLTAYLRAVIAGFWNAGFRKQILLNGHGQDYVIPTAMHQFGKKYQVPCILINVNWWFVIPEHLRDREHGGPFETPFIHGDECEASFSMALFPEFIDLQYAEKTTFTPLLPPGHINKSGSALPLAEAPLPFWQQVGGSPLEVVATPQGTVGDATLADPEKAKGGVNAILDYLERLVNDIMAMYPACKLPPIEQVSMRPRQEVEAVLKGPRQPGGRHLYTFGYPP